MCSSGEYPSSHPSTQSVDTLAEKSMNRFISTNVCETVNRIEDNHTHLTELRISLWNSQSFNSLKASFIKNIGSDITILTEVWNPKDSIRDKFNNAYFSCRGNGKGGGVAVIPNYSALQMNYFSSPCSDILIAKATCDSQNLLWFIVVYIPPLKQSTYCSLILHLLDTLIPISDWPRCVILGDFNMNLKQPSQTLRQFTQKLKEKDFDVLDSSIINHSRPKSKTLIDYWFCGRSINIPQILSPSTIHLFLTIA